MNRIFETCLLTKFTLELTLLSNLASETETWIHLVDPMQFEAHIKFFETCVSPISGLNCSKLC